jgi:mlo protein
VDSVCVFDQMGSSFKSAVFADDVADHLRGWADGARRRMRRSATAGDAAGCLGAERSLEGRSRPDQLRSISF